MITVNELFSGIGSQVKALQRLGIQHKVVGISEIDDFAICNYEAMHGQVRNYGEISTVPRLDYADLWTYSFPCQDISVAGSQAGINKGTRSGLLYEVKRLLDIANADKTLPKYLLLENVKNLVGNKFKVPFMEWLFYLNELGYNHYCQVLNAKNYGVPQNRERVFCVSIRSDIDTGNFEFPKPFDNGVRLKDVLQDEVDEKFYIKQELSDKLIANLKNKEISNTIRVGGRGSIDNRHSWDLVEVGTLKGCGMPYNKMYDQSGRVYSPDGICPTLTTCGGGNLEPKIIQRSTEKNKGGLFDDCPTITTSCFQENNVLRELDVLRCERTDYRIRKLTPLECWRLMGFDDEDFYKAKQALNDTFYKGKDRSNSQLYKQAGNSIVVNVLEGIFKNLF